MVDHLITNNKLKITLNSNDVKIEKLFEYNELPDKTDIDEYNKFEQKVFERYEKMVGESIGDDNTKKVLFENELKDDKEHFSAIISCVRQLYC